MIWDRIHVDLIPRIHQPWRAAHGFLEATSREHNDFLPIFDAIGAIACRPINDFADPNVEEVVGYQEQVGVHNVVETEHPYRVRIRRL